MLLTPLDTNNLLFASPNTGTLPLYLSRISFAAVSYDSLEDPSSPIDRLPVKRLVLAAITSFTTYAQTSNLRCIKS
uniref:Uncharacterized protein n=1 Tax=Parascaris equorum TaxID=6256 RepID=A0A914RT36_PAREQ